MTGKLVVSFPWKKRTQPKRANSNNKQEPSLVEQTQTPSLSRSTKYRHSLKSQDTAKHDAQKELDRKRWHKRKVPIKTLPIYEQEDQKQKWAEQKRLQRARAQTRKLTTETPVKKKRHDMSESEKKEYWRLSREKIRDRRSKQKKAADQLKERCRKTVQPEVQNEAPCTPKRFSSRATLYRTVNSIKPLMLDTPRSYFDVVDKLMLSASPKKKAGLQRRGLKRKLCTDDSTADVLKSSIKDAKTSRSNRRRLSYYEQASAFQRDGFKYRQALEVRHQL